MEIYIKAAKKVVSTDRTVTIGHICEIVKDADSNGRIGDITLLKAPERGSKGNYFTVISGLDIVRAIKAKYPSATVISMGEDNTLVHFLSAEKGSRLFKYLKIAFITLILFTGCATAIVAFHVESQLNSIFAIYAGMLGLQTSEQTRLYLEIPYALGIAVGIIIFFNHIFGKGLTGDPTPIEVEMATYEKDVVDTLIDNEGQV